MAVRYGYGTFFRVNLFNKAGLPAVPFRTDTFAPDTYYRLFADSEIRRFPEAWQLDHGKRLYFGYAQRSRLLCDVTSLEENRRP